ncbi:hypothetical protein D3C71_2047730 [compost metagenome]
MAISLLLPVVRTMEPNLLDSAISKVPRMRACRFSSVVSSGRPAKSCASAALKLSNIGAIEISSYCTPSRLAMSRASIQLMSAV